jgi:phage tail-like protein
MTNGRVRVRFRDHLPEVFSTGGAAQAAAGAPADQAALFLDRFLAPFEELFEELQREIAGAPGQAGGLPDLFDPDRTPPADLPHRAGDEFDYLSYLAGWIGLSLRPERSVDWNRRFFRRAVELAPLRGTLAGLDALLRAWLADDLVGGDAAPPLLTDLTRAHNQVDTVFQLDEAAVLGVQTVLGEGPPFFFVVDLVADPTVRELRNPIGLDVLQRATRSLLAAEKPAFSYYQLRLRAHTMQLAPADPADKRRGEVYAQLEDSAGEQTVLGTTLLWDEPLVFDSDLDQRLD